MELRGNADVGGIGFGSQRTCTLIPRGKGALLCILGAAEADTIFSATYNRSSLAGP